MTREELIAALEAAEGPSRELDLWVWAQFEPVRARIIDGVLHEFASYFVKRGNCYLPFDPLDSRAPRYTASLDAAMTLVPDGWLVSIYEQPWGPSGSLFTVTLRTRDARYETMAGQGGEEVLLVEGREASGIQRPTLPLALAIAALKARP